MIKIICVGKLKEKYLIDACNEYLKRLQKYTNIEIIEIQDEKIDEEKQSLQKEKEKLTQIGSQRRKIPPRAYRHIHRRSRADKAETYYHRRKPGGIHLPARNEYRF